VATGGKCSEPEKRRNKPKPLPWVATGCRSERMVRRGRRFESVRGLKGSACKLALYCCLECRTRGHISDTRLVRATQGDVSRRFLTRARPNENGELSRKLPANRRLRLARKARSGPLPVERGRRFESVRGLSVSSRSAVLRPGDGKAWVLPVDEDGLAATDPAEFYFSLTEQRARFIGALVGDTPPSRARLPLIVRQRSRPELQLLQARHRPCSVTVRPRPHAGHLGFWLVPAGPHILMSGEEDDDAGARHGSPLPKFA
jgi:hypothetical protein